MNKKSGLKIRPISHLNILLRFLQLTFVTFLTISCDENMGKSASKLKITPETQQALTEFHKQDHRFEFNNCIIKYNDKEFDLNTSIDTIIEILGPFDRRIATNKDRTSYSWIDNKITIFEENASKKLTAFAVDLFLMDMLDIQTEKTDFYILIDGIPLDSKITMGEFIANSTYDLKDFYIDNHSYKHIKTQCNIPIKYFFLTDVDFSRTGAGHLTIQDGPDFSQTYPVKSFQVSRHK